MSQHPEQIDQFIRALAAQAQSSEPPSADLSPVDSLPAEELARRDWEQDINLKRTYAKWLLGALISQMILANLVFVLYASLGVQWELTVAVINVWLIGTLAEVIGLVLVVTRYLFPNRDSALA